MLVMYSGQIKTFSSHETLLFFFCFSSLKISWMSLYSSYELPLNFKSLTNQSYLMVLEIIFYMKFLIVFYVKSPIMCVKNISDETFIFMRIKKKKN